MTKHLIELILDNKGVPRDILTSSSDVVVVCRFPDVEKVFVPNPKVDPTLLQRYLKSPKLHGKLGV